jgi:hypothetical protein
MFYEKFVDTGRIKLIALGERARAVDDDELDQIAEELRAAPTSRSKVPILTDEQMVRRQQAQAGARKKRRAKATKPTRVRPGSREGGHG